MEIGLVSLLRSRDARVERQRELLSLYPDMTLLCLTVIIPGSVKRNDNSLRIARAGMAAVREAFQTVYEEQRDLDTGFEAFFIVDMPPLDAKRLACRIEDTHPLGRLMDLDVVVSDSCKDSNQDDGQAAALPVPLSRGSIGLAPRRCLICDRPAKECMRSRAHPTEELLKKIDELLENGLNP